MDFQKCGGVADAALVFLHEMSHAVLEDSGLSPTEAHRIIYSVEFSYMLAAYFSITTVENYGATKAYLLSLTESLHVALRGTGIHVQALAPGFTMTEFHSRLGADFTNDQRRWMRAEEVVDRSLKALEKRQVVCIPGIKNWLLVKGTGVLPRRVYYRVMHFVGEKVRERWSKIEKTRKVR